MDHEAVDILRKCRLFSSLTGESLSLAEPLARVVRFKKGQRIFSQGDVCPGFYCVGSGCVRVFKVSPGGKDHVLHFADPGLTFAEVAAIGDFPCPAFAEAAEDTVCVMLPAEPLRRLLQQENAFCFQLLKGMSLWVRQFVDLLEDIVLRDAGSRLARHLLRSDKSGGTRPFSLPVLKKDLASHLNLTSETLSRTLRRFAQAGLIETSNGDLIRILNGDAMEDIAQGLPPDVFT